MKVKEFKKIPAGYKWCLECDALTPHKSDTCELCNFNNPDKNLECPNCGWAPELSEIKKPCESSKIKKHSPDCDAKKRIEEYYTKLVLDEGYTEFDETLLEEFRNCSCPSVEVFTRDYFFITDKHFDKDNTVTVILRCLLCNIDYALVVKI